MLDPVPVMALRERCEDAVANVRSRVLAETWSVRLSERLDALRDRLVEELRGGVR